MTRRLQCLSIIGLLFIQHIKAQTGAGCFLTTCPTVGQVRINAIIDGNGMFLGGCNCGCEPSLGDPSSRNYCAPPNVVNFDPMTLQGDCSCVAPTPTVPQPAYTYNVPAPVPGYQAPAVPAPAPLPPGNPVELLCEGSTPGAVCECPVGTRGECNLICEAPDSCMNAIINCNNDGYPCFVACLGETSCSGFAQINGPVGSLLEVTCGGEKSCEGSTQFNGQFSTDTVYACEGMTSCSGATFNFGSQVSLVECAGEPDACKGAQFILPFNAQTTQGSSYRCEGISCPEAGVYAPMPFSNIVPVSGTCTEPGGCSCAFGANAPCTINCDGQDACKDGVISCNSDGFDCIINCVAETSCGGSSEFVGPRGAALTVNCMGNKACEGSIRVEGAVSTHVTVNCNGHESCKGSAVMKFGRGVGSLSCLHAPDGCQGASIILLNGVETLAGAAFSCTGDGCPPDAPAAFSNGAPATTAAGPQYGGYQPYQYPVPQSTIPAVPAPPTVIVGSPYCCLTSIPNFKPWAGRCWDETTLSGCMSEPNSRCVWDVANCLPNPPVNTLLRSTPCLFYDAPCTANSQCCSETCNSNGLCR